MQVEAFAEATARIVKAATAPLIKRIEELEARQLQMGPAGKDGRDGLDGKDATDAMVMEAVELFLSNNPPPSGKDGADGKDGRDGIDGKDGRDGADGRDGIDGKDGIGLADALIDHRGVLVLTMTDGRTKELSEVVGRNGENGRDGVDGRNGEDGKNGLDGKDGQNGRDGVDGEKGDPGEAGLGFEDIDVNLADDGRTVVLSFERGELRQSFEISFPIVIDRGVYKEGAEYEKGDGVTWGGSYWIAQDKTSDKPGEAGWRLAVKKGRDGKDGKDGERGEKGLPGEKGSPGRDGRTW